MYAIIGREKLLYFDASHCNWDGEKVKKKVAIFIFKILRMPPRNISDK
jgi:hypothetical protein